ncbi:hypothetical protein B7494_g7952 [Chlorociboria aeruginascens]|nr:hypothetical protein B7494_g7952 [Chlorociboria aeruginascens]
MRLSTFYALSIGSIALAQSDYPELPIDYLLTSKPTTPLPQGSPWGCRTSNGTNPYPPYTGVIRSYDWTVARGFKAPDGYEKEGLFINDQFPGPLIEANWGDTIQVTLYNNISGPEDGTALHWHGILQKAYPLEDFNPNFLYSTNDVKDGWTVFLVFNNALSRMENLLHIPLSQTFTELGGITPTTHPNKGPVILSDYYHSSSLQLEEAAVGTDITKVAPFSNNNLINGRNNFDCSTKDANDTTPCESNAGITHFRFTPGHMKFKARSHPLLTFYHPRDLQVLILKSVVTVGIGQRVDVIVEGLESTGAFTMRSVLADCSDDYQPLATAIVYYTREALLRGSNSTAWPALADSLADCGNDDISLSVPWFPITPTEPTITQEIEINVTRNETGHYLWTVDNSSFRADYNDPVLLLSNQGNDSYPEDPEWNVYNFGSNTSIRIVLRNPGFAVHPMHLHGHNFYILAAGPGEWDGTTIVNPENPLRRDTVLIPAYSYAVIQFEADNPGTWPFHCHIAAHVAGGLYFTVLERPNDIVKLNIPDIMAQTCDDYVAWQQTVVVDQIDSGV